MITSTISDVWKSLRETGSITISMATPNKTFLPLVMDPNANLAYWSAKERFTAVLLGYGLIALIAALYVSKLAPITSSPRSRRIEQRIVDLIKQAGGVCKVIFIISIEMIAFPLFCGFLLDLALLPLFEYSTIASRISFGLLEGPCVRLIRVRSDPSMQATSRAPKRGAQIAGLIAV